ncbi:MAG: DUF4837 family protein [Rhodothermales bacterium]|nr:DUF4837 family protein [Rhodothermales bacterium]
MKKSYIGVFLILPALFLAGCDDLKYTPTAVGKEGNVVIVADTLLWASPVGAALREEIGYPISTLPAPEPSFGIETFPLIGQASLNRIKAQKNVVIAAALDDSSQVTRLIRSLFAEDALQAVYTSGGATILRNDLWRLSQKVAIVTAPTNEQLIDEIKNAGPEIRSQFNEISRTRTNRDMFKKGRQFEVEERLLNDHGFAVNVQHDFQVAIDTTDFIWLRRILSSESWRSVFVHYVENGNPAEMTPEWIYNTRDSLTQKYVTGNLNGFVEIDRRRPLETENISFNDSFGFETRGLWQMMTYEDGEKRQFGMGGPFVTYTFYDQDSGRIYLVDGMVFAPGYQKREFLRQVEVISYTFRTLDEVETAVTSSTREIEQELLSAPVRLTSGQ